MTSKSTQIFFSAVLLISPLAILSFYLYNRKISASATESTNEKKRKILILYSTTTGSSRNFANLLRDKIFKLYSSKCDVTAMDINDYDEENLANEDIVFLLLSTSSDGRATEKGERFSKWIEDMVYDFRVNRDIFKKIKFSIFGLGGQVYGENFCKTVIYL